MEKSDREVRLKSAQEKARKVREILIKEGVTFAEAICFSSEIFQLLAVMGEANIMLTKHLTYLALRLQDSELTNGLLGQPELSSTSSKTTDNPIGDKG
jgi:hypothetical protein